ncbi:MAG: hypothetical protein AABX07_03005 [Nanoarchaeota archaeon]
MGFLDFFRKKEQKAEKIEKITLSELENRISSEKENLAFKDKEAKEKVKRILAPLISELKFQADLLRKIDLEKRKEHERIKIIVKENLGYYASHLEKLAGKLEKINENFGAEEYIIEMQSCFNNFKVNSRKSFEKATILVGKELEQIQDNFRDFFSNFNRIVEGEKEIFEKRKNLEALHNLKKEFNELEKSVLEIGGNVENIEKTKKELETERNSASLEFKALIESEEFKKNLESKERAKREISDLNKNAFKLKESIDIKFLLKFFHENPKKTEVLKKYRERFLSMLEADENFEIVEMVNVALGVDIHPEVNALLEKSRQLKENNNGIEARITALETKIKNLDFELAAIDRKAYGENKKIEKAKEKNEQLKKELASKVKKILGKVEIAEEEV